MEMYEKIKKIADERGVSIYRIEKDTGLSNGAISKWNKAQPSSSNLMKVAEYLKVDMKDLLKKNYK